MAPTAILATQHLENYKKMFNQFGIKCELLISAITKKKKQELLERLESGEIDILIGTHAIIEENVKFKNLGLVVTDEQHRFGVKQRTKIVEKGQNPDVLVMTATPIPRTLALILYGDLDISIIDELPPNRKKIDTFAVKKGLEERVNNFVKKQINEGRQCYIVCPLVEESEEMDLKSVIELYNTCKEDTFKELPDGSYMVSASLKLDDLDDLLHVNLDSEDYDSLGGYIIELLDHLPSEGEIAEDEHFTFKVVSVDKNRMETIHIIPKENSNHISQN